MTIYHAQTLLLFFLPVALGTAIEFSNCEIDIQYTGVVNITKVEIIPYPIKFHDNPIFKISGVTCKVSICDVTKCPIEPGPFVLTVPNLYAVKGNDHQSVSFSVHTCINTR
ncbi:hypothetical protein N665_0045s0062 [Sinapis alba]|nr:hypothetical protein N665_0045s0062 [Sinapis alba]